jgi:ParB family chromosome partitioning protein
VNALLRIRRAFGPAFLDRVANGTGDAAGVEDALARAAYRDLERLAGEPDDEKRLSATRRLLGWAGVPVASPRERGAYSHRSKRGGGFVLEVHEPVEALAAGDAATLRELLESQLARVKARLETLGRG